jgi:Ca2+-binding RTX toxin-like protein
VTTAIDSASTTDSLTLIADYTTTTTTGTASGEALNGTSADNRINAADGDDTVAAADGNDLVLGGTGNDSIAGGAGSDLLLGEAGNDTLSGGSQSDRLVGGAGNDTLTGGTGAGDLLTDVFQWQLGDGGAAGSPAADTITDFNASAATAGGDILDLRDLLVGESPSNLTNYLHFSTSGDSTVVSISTNGAFAGGYASGLVNQTITLTGIDLVGGKTDAQIIEDLLKNGSLVAGG